MAHKPDLVPKPGREWGLEPRLRLEPTRALEPEWVQEPVQVLALEPVQVLALEPVQGLV